MKIIHGDNINVLKSISDNSIDSVVTDPPYGISFMGKKRDYDVPSVELWKEVLRVLKPGGHALVACGTRTQHRMAVNLEDAGFEIRDIVAWVYSSGFPKSLNIGKSIENKIKTGNASKNGFHKLNGERRSGIIGMYDMAEAQGFRKVNPAQLGAFDLEPTTEEAKKWNGWGTGLKPAMELRTLCRKPLSEKNIAENILKWGTGGINIDGCRVGEEKITINRHEGQSNSLVESTKGEWEGKQEIVQGRYPANFIHDGSDEVVSLFPNSKGSTQSKAIKNTGSSWKNSSKEIRWTTYNDDGSASRFFYCGKASKSEKNKGLDGFEEKRPDTRTSTGMGVFEEKGIANYHPTVKPVKLMRYLCRLVTPVGGIVLDPFMGSGTTGIGAKLEGFDFIGIEKEEEYFNIAQARIDAW